MLDQWKGVSLMKIKTKLYSHIGLFDYTKKLFKTPNKFFSSTKNRFSQ